MSLQVKAEQNINQEFPVEVTGEVIIGDTSSAQQAKKVL